MSYRIDPTKPVDAELRRVAADELDRALTSLQTTPEPDEDDVHDARKRMKKLRAVLRLARGGLGDEVYRAENGTVRDAAALLSGVRDADVLVGTLDGLLPALAGEEAISAFARARIVLDGDAARARTEARRTAAVRRVIGELVAVRARVPQWPLSDRGWSTLEAGVERQHRRGRKARKAVEADATDEALHDWRKRAKNLWYQLRLLEGLWPPVTGPLVDEAHRLSDLLGDDHDLAVLRSALVERVDAADVLIEVLDARRAPLQQEARALGVLLYLETPSAWGARLASWWEVAASG